MRVLYSPGLTYRTVKLCLGVALHMKQKTALLSRTANTVRTGGSQSFVGYGQVGQVQGHCEQTQMKSRFSSRRYTVEWNTVDTGWHASHESWVNGGRHGGPQNSIQGWAAIGLKDGSPLAASRGSSPVGVWGMHKYLVYWGFRQHLQQIKTLFNISRGESPPPCPCLRAPSVDAEFVVYRSLRCIRYKGWQ